MHKILKRKEFEQFVGPAMSQCEHTRLYGDPYKYSSTANYLPPPRKKTILAAPMGILVGYC
jgi:hypothetical protein